MKSAIRAPPLIACDSPPTCKCLRLSLDSVVATLTLNRPEHLNAGPPPLVCDELCAALQQLAAPGAGALLITGEGRNFCSGVDLQTRVAAVNKGDIEAGCTLLQTTYPDSERDADGRTARPIAVLRADLPLVKLPIASGANRHAEDRFGQTPVSYATASGDTTMVQALRESFNRKACGSGAAGSVTSRTDSTELTRTGHDLVVARHRQLLRLWTGPVGRQFARSSAARH